MLLPDDIALRFAAQPPEAPPALEALVEAERERLAAFGSARRRREYALGRTAARELLAERLDLAPAEVPLVTAEDGAPQVEGSPWHVSIAHTATAEALHAVAAAAPRPVGVDLETIRPRRPDLYRFLRHPEEGDLLARLPYAPEVAPVLVWALKEATLKAMRTGLRCSPKRLLLTMGAPGEARALLDGEKDWALRYAEREGCFLAVAFEP